MDISKKYQADLKSKPALIHERIEYFAEQKPNLTAIVCGSNSITYGELGDRVNLLAEYLVSMGLEGNTTIGLYFSRSINAVVSTLAVLKAGLVCLNIDSRNGDLSAFQDENFSLILTEISIEKDLRRYSDDHTSVIAIDGLDGNLCKSVTPIALSRPLYKDAFVIYTSGSTGSPKRVTISHENVAYYLDSLQETISVCEQDVYLHFASFVFSSSNRQMLLPLYNGASLLIAREEDKVNLNFVVNMVVNQKVTILDLIPSVWRAVRDHILCLNESDIRDFTEKNCIRLALSASEPLHSDVVAFWHKVLGQSSRFINMFGTTESCGIVCTYEVPRNVCVDDGVVAIGSPIANTSVQIVDENGNPVSGSNTGYLLIKSNAISKESLNYTDAVSHDKWFKSGDLCYRRRDEDTIFYSGRADDQLKILGGRVSLVEIENALYKNERIKECFVSKYDGPMNREHIIAYYTCHNPKDVSYSEMYELANKYLPKYKVPSRFLEVDQFPRTKSGKIDRLALLKLEMKSDEYKVIETPIQKAVFDSWEKALGYSEFGIDSNFFEAGGDSLTLFTVLSEVNNKFGSKISVVEFLENPTIDSLASLLEDFNYKLSSV